MNTIGKEVTSTFFKDANGFAQLQARWSALVQDMESRERLTAAHYLIYAVLRGKDWRKGFSEDTNANRLANGKSPWSAAANARYLIAVGTATSGRVRIGERTRTWLLEPFGDLLVDDALEQIARLLPRINPNLDLMEQDAYLQPVAVEVAA